MGRAAVTTPVGATSAADMKILAVILFMLAGVGVLSGIHVLTTTVTVGFGAYFGAFVLPALLVWWGVIALRVAEKRNRSNS